MTNLSTFSMLHERVAKYKVDYSLETNSAAFSWLALETILHLNSDDIEDAITDGTMDGGIDAIFISDRTVNVFTFKYTDSFEHSRRNFPETDLDRLLVTMQGIYGVTLSKDSVNEALWEKANEIWGLYSVGALTFRYYICSNKEKPVEHARRRFENTLREYRLVEFHYLDQEDLVNKILERKYRRVNGQLTFVDKQYFERSDGNVKGIVATVAADDLVKLVCDPDDPEQINEDVFNDNIRIYKKGNRINERILETALSDENYQFWYLNNGITIVCEECSYAPNTRSPRVSLTDFQIVNGGQTTHALFEAYHKDAERVRNVLLLVRICQTRRENPIADKISETTNSQTPVTTRDLHANDRIQRKLEDEFRSLGYFYERKANQYEEESASHRLNNELLAQLYLAYYMDMPSEAKNNKSLIFGDKYGEVFKEDTITASRMLLPLRVYLPLQAKKREIQRRKRRREQIDEQEAFVSRAVFHIVNVVKFVAEYGGLDLARDVDIQSAIAKAIALISQVVQKESEARGSVYTHDKFFKEVQTNDRIRVHVEDAYRGALSPGA